MRGAVDRGDGPKRAYAGLIGLLALSQPISAAQIEALPDPDLFRDAVLLSRHGMWTPSELDGVDALLLAVVDRIANVRKG